MAFQECETGLVVVWIWVEISVHYLSRPRLGTWFTGFCIILEAMLTYCLGETCWDIPKGRESKLHSNVFVLSQYAGFRNFTEFFGTDGYQSGQFDQYQVLVWPIRCWFSLRSYLLSLSLNDSVTHKRGRKCCRFFNGGCCFDYNLKWCKFESFIIESASK